MIDVFANFLGDEVPRVSFDRGSGRRDEELLEIPRNVGSLDGRPSDEKRIGHQRVGVVMRCWES